ncbi:MAG TPA: cytochrome c oxidase subunit II [Polyangiaceae bacterium]|nr:cytochrome c oxidase subunit II [Polyangiaceae bacterium]
MNELLRRLLFLPPQGTSLAREVDYLHYSVVLSTMAGSAVVAATAMWFAVRYRRRSPTTAGESEVAEAAPRLSYGFELAAILGLLALFVGWWVVGFRQFVKLETPPLDALTIQVVAKQWMWTFAYPSGAASNAVLYVPASRAVKLVLTSRDVIHSFYVPAFRIKQDAVPGQSTSIWFEAEQPGTYPVYCAEYCGTDHSTMRAQVVVLPSEDFARRLERLPPLDIPAADGFGSGPLVRSRSDGTSLARLGEGVAARHGCLRCHTLDGTPHVGPTWARLYQSDVALEDGTSVRADESYLTESMMDPRVKVRRGFAAVMPTYQGVLDAAEVGALVELIRSLRDFREAPSTTPLAPAGAPSVIPLPRSPLPQLRSPGDSSP